MLQSDPSAPGVVDLVDAHHHLWDRPSGRYLLQEYLDDLASGPPIAASVYVESRTALARSGPPDLRPVGETRFAAAVGALGDSGLYGPTRVAQAVVAFADLTGERIGQVLDEHEAAGAGRLRGVRHSSYWDADPVILGFGSMTPPPQLLLRPAFRDGATELARRGLSLDVVLFHTQLGELIDLARALPQLTIVLNHMGTPLGLGRFAGHRAEVFDQWRADLTELARSDNVVVKLGGAGRPQWGFGFHDRPVPPTPEELAAAIRPYVATCLDLFGPRRCMAESNFPADSISYPYAVYWAAIDLLTRDLTTDERAGVLATTARRTYRLTAV